MISLSTLLTHYKRKDIQDEMVRSASDREVAVRFSDKGFGKRPDILKYPRDVIEFAKQGATSFHVSEERWENVQRLGPNLKRAEIDSLRRGWDLVIDIDCPIFELSKLIAFSVIEALKKHGISSVSCKFSGNKGFHIGVPFKAFPKTVQGKDTRLLFPDGTKRIVQYLIDYIDSIETGCELSEKILQIRSLSEIAKDFDMDEKKLMKRLCKKCGRSAPDKKKEATEFICTRCGKVLKDEKEKYMTCPTCNIIMEKQQFDSEDKCRHCSNRSFIEKFDSSEILNIDTLLISSRHLYRMPYSLHEKSGLVSVPFNPEKILSFMKEFAHPGKFRVSERFRFLDETHVKENEGKRLIIQAFDHKPEIEEDEIIGKKEFEIPEDAIPEKFFPPCIIKGLAGLDDGKKRFLFILVNFLTSSGWNYDQIEKEIAEWNKRNKEPLREVYIKSHLKHHKKQKKKILPPNCDNKMYYQDLRICLPDNLCKKIKNPVNYSRIKTRYIEKGKKTKKGVKK